MGLEIEHPQQFLEEAKQAVAAYQVVSGQLKAQREEERQAATALEKLRKETQERIQKTVKARGEEITATYDKQLSQVDGRLKKAQDERERARKEGVKGRIRKETEPLVTENRELRRQLAAILKKDHAPAFCKTGVFYTLFRPSGFGEIFACLLTFVLIFAALPFGIYYLISQHQIWQLVLIYVIDILVVGGLYVAVMNATIGKHAAVIRDGRKIKNQIRRNKKKLKAMTRAIRSDANESGYNLESFDDEITKAQQERNDVISRKQGAQNTFETVTKNILTDEIETAARPQLEELQQRLKAATERRQQLESEEKEQALALSQRYEQYLGKGHMNASDIDRIAAMLEEGSAASIIDAVAKLEHPAQ
ncbi:MAG TPA: hypothetical protein DIW34_01175 [Oribacterium sp.]|nr:hypothetical protein [Oribacterium sp.]